METFMKADVAVIGLGYIGLPTAAILAIHGFNVIGVDINQDTVAALSRGQVPFAEPDLATAVSGAVSLGRLQVTLDVPRANTFIIAVPTPLQVDNKADLSHIRAATAAIAPLLDGSELIILESTSPPGTTNRVGEWLKELRPDLEIAGTSTHDPVVNIAHCPERVLPGRILVEIVTNDRIIGGITTACAERAARLYATFCQGDIAITNAKTAELVKLVENSYRDVNIAFANELANICESFSLDAWEVIELANRHPRVSILSPGPGVGGHCIAVDPWFIVGAAPSEATLIHAAREVNDGRPLRVAEGVISCARRFREPKLAFLGLSYKANIEDTRESPAISVIHHVARLCPDSTIMIVDPHVREMPAALKSHTNARLLSADNAVREADIVALLVDHTAFRSVSAHDLAGKVVFDTRGFWRR